MKIQEEILYFMCTQTKFYSTTKVIAVNSKGKIILFIHAILNLSESIITLQILLKKLHSMNLN